MDSCGTRMKVAHRRAEPGVKGAAQYLAGAVLATVLTGCTMEFGTRPLTDRLETLTLGESGKTDVLLALGEPRGDGAVELGVAPGHPRDIWLYEYVRSDGSTVDLKMLLVFFRGDTYDGHLWFSSVDEFN